MYKFTYICYKIIIYFKFNIYIFIINLTICYILNHLSNQQINEFVSNVVTMSDNITNTYAMVEEQTKLTMESMSLTNEILDYANTRINQLESNLNFIKLLACHRDWIKMFIVKSTIQLGEEQLKDAGILLNYSGEAQIYQNRSVIHLKN